MNSGLKVGSAEVKKYSVFEVVASAMLSMLGGYFSLIGAVIIWRDATGEYLYEPMNQTGEGTLVFTAFFVVIFLAVLKLRLLKE